jgi:uncharacterized membrane protein YvbJ
VLNAVNDPQDTVNNFVTAIQQGDIEKMKSLIDPDDNKMEITDKQLQNIVKYAQQHNDYFEKIKYDLNNEIGLSKYSKEDLAKMGMDGPSYEDYANMDDFYLKKHDYFLFTSYSIGVKPYYLYVSTNEAGASIKVEGKDVYKTTGDKNGYTVGPLMPGMYTVSAEKKYPYADLTQSDEIELLGKPEHKASSSLDLSGSTVNIKSNFDDTWVYINGKPLGKQVKDLENFDQYGYGQFGSVVLNGTIKIQGERQFPWGKSRSDEQVLEPNTAYVDITPNPFSTKEQQKAVQNLINMYEKQYAQAFVTQNPNVLTVIDDNYRKSIVDTLNTDKTWGWKYKGTVLGTRIDFDHVALSYQNGIYQVRIPVEVHRTLTEILPFNTDQTPKEKYDRSQVILTYDEKNKKWVVSGEDYLLDDNVFNGKNVVKSVFK